MKIFFVSLGCDKNLVDSEVMLGLLKKNRYTITDNEAEADMIVVNTCCFIHDAKEESVETILEMAQYKQTGSCKGLIVTGCLAEEYRDEIMKEIPEVDAVLGTSSYAAIADTLKLVAEGGKSSLYKDVNFLPDTSEVSRVVTTGSYMAYMKIAEGCDKHCTYCIIPKLRGTYRSIPMEQLIREAEYLASQGMKELVLVAQETTIYGVDLYKEKSLHRLLRELCRIDGIEWIRVLYCYPEEIYDDLIETMASEPKICHYIDMPIQHSEDTILSRMGRKTNKKQLEQIIYKLRDAMEDIAIRTTLITGFPGETVEEHEALLDFINDMEFDRLGAFTYSAEEGTPAAEYRHQVSESIKEQRKAAIMELQQEISFEKNQKKIGKQYPVMIEGYLYEEHVYVGRTYMDAPKVDGTVFVTSPEELISGDIVNVKITGASEYDLTGEVVYEFTE
ncbi:MAG: 30S ribosomal protein S12 methylthiotransferase RimO [Lachnospiraceae bacterium]